MLASDLFREVKEYAEKGYSAIKMSVDDGEGSEFFYSGELIDSAELLNLLGVLYQDRGYVYVQLKKGQELELHVSSERQIGELRVESVRIMEEGKAIVICTQTLDE